MNIKQMLVMFAVIPLVIGLLVVTMFTVEYSVNTFKDDIRSELKLAAKSLKEYYEYDLINDNDLVDGFCEYDTDYIDRMAETGIEFTLFKEKNRFMSTIKDGDGKRIEGTPASPEVWDTILNGEDYFDTNLNINGSDYYGYYMPLGSNGNIMGMAFAGKLCDDVNQAKNTLYIIFLYLFQDILLQ